MMLFSRITPGLLAVTEELCSIIALIPHKITFVHKNEISRKSNRTGINSLGLTSEIQNTMICTMRDTSNPNRLELLLEGQRASIESAMAEAEAELLSLRSREAELIHLIRRARVALGQQDIDVSDTSQRPRTTLHDAMALVLREQGAPMSGKDLADEINRRGLYRQKDGSPVPLNQVHARANNYRDLFAKEGRRIGLKE